MSGDAWKVTNARRSQHRGLWDAVASDGTHTIVFESLSQPVDDRWVREQVEAFDDKSFRLACSHCPDQPEPFPLPEVTDGD